MTFKVRINFLSHYKIITKTFIFMIMTLKVEIMTSYLIIRTFILESMTLNLIVMTSCWTCIFSFVAEIGFHKHLSKELVGVKLYRC